METSSISSFIDVRLHSQKRGFKRTLFVVALILVAIIWRIFYLLEKEGKRNDSLEARLALLQPGGSQ